MSRELHTLKLLATLDGTEWGRRIKAAREAKGLSQLAATEKAGMNPVHYGDVERGKKNVGAAVIYKIVTALRLNPAALFGPDAARSFPGNSGDDHAGDGV